MSDRSAFLDGALAWIHPEGAPDICGGCGFAWASDPVDVLREIDASPTIYESLLSGRDGMVPAADGGWNATGYVWHLVDLARSWAERWVQLADAPGSMLVGWDPDVLADARGYRSLPTASALWALRDAVGSFVSACDRVAMDTPFEHGDWGTGTVGDGIRWLGHEFVHHRHDVDDRAG